MCGLDINFMHLNSKKAGQIKWKDMHYGAQRQRLQLPPGMLTMRTEGSPGPRGDEVRLLHGAT